MSGLSGLNALDVIVLLIVVSSTIAAMIAGLARSGIGLLCAIVGVLCGLWLYATPAHWVHAFIDSDLIASVFGFLIVFFPFVIIGGVAGKIVMRLFQWTGLGWMDRAAGAVFGFFRGALVAVAFISLLLAFVSKPVPHWITSSSVLPYAITASDTLSKLAPQSLTDSVSEKVRETRELWTQQLNKGREEVEAFKPKAEPAPAKPAPAKPSKKDRKH